MIIPSVATAIMLCWPSDFTPDESLTNSDSIGAKHGQHCFLKLSDMFSLAS